jgi:hypothetical protein
MQKTAKRPAHVLNFKKRSGGLPRVETGSGQTQRPLQGKRRKNEGGVLPARTDVGVAPYANKTRLLSQLSLDYVCPEPVLVK